MPYEGTEVDCGLNFIKLDLEYRHCSFRWVQCQAVGQGLCQIRYILVILLGKGPQNFELVLRFTALAIYLISNTRKAASSHKAGSGERAARDQYIM